MVFASDSRTMRIDDFASFSKMTCLKRPAIGCWLLSSGSLLTQA